MRGPAGAIECAAAPAVGAAATLNTHESRLNF